MFKSNKLIVIASRGLNSARISYNPMTGKEKNKLVGDVEQGGNMAALQLVNYTLSQLIESGFTGKATIVTHNDVATRGYSFRKANNAGLDEVSAMITETMSPEYAVIVEEFCAAMTDLIELGADIRFVKFKNLHVWDLKIADEFIPVTEENKNLVGTFLDFADGICEEYAAQTNLLKGKYEITTYNERIDGKSVEVLALVRPCHSVAMMNLHKAESAVWALCPEVEIDFDEFDDDATDGAI